MTKKDEEEGERNLFNWISYKCSYKNICDTNCIIVANDKFLLPTKQRVNSNNMSV